MFLRLFLVSIQNSTLHSALIVHPSTVISIYCHTTTPISYPPTHHQLTFSYILPLICFPFYIYTPTHYPSNHMPTIGLSTTIHSPSRYPHPLNHSLTSSPIFHPIIFPTHHLFIHPSIHLYTTLPASIHSFIYLFDYLVILDSLRDTVISSSLCPLKFHILAYENNNI